MPSPTRSSPGRSPGAGKAHLSPVRFRSHDDTPVTPLNHFGEDDIPTSSSSSVRIAAPANSTTTEQDNQQGRGISSAEEEAQFRKKRLAHYNEFKVLQALRKSRADEEDDDDDDDDDDDS